MSRLSDKFVENAEEFIGQDMDVKVTRVDLKKNRAVFSHKIVLNEEKQKACRDMERSERRRCCRRCGNEIYRLRRFRRLRRNRRPVTYF